MSRVVVVGLSRASRVFIQVLRFSSHRKINLSLIHLSFTGLTLYKYIIVLLLSIFKNSMQQLQKAIKGFVVMSLELDEVYTCFTNNQVIKL